MKKIFQNNERGSALLLTLGVMSLALIMAMSFAFTARTEVKIAKVNSDFIRARLQGESDLNTAVALLKEAMKDTVEGGVPKLPKIGDVWQKQDIESKPEFYFRHLPSSGDSGFTPDFSFKKLAEKSKSSYVQELAKVLVGDEDKYCYSYYDGNNKIIGRSSVLIVNDSGKIDLNEITPLGENRLDPLKAPWCLRGKERIAKIENIGTVPQDSYSYNIGYNLTPIPRYGIYFHEMKGGVELDSPEYIPDKNGFMSHDHFLHKQPEADWGKAIEKYTCFSPESEENYKTDVNNSSNSVKRWDITGTEFYFKDLKVSPPKKNNSQDFWDYIKNDKTNFLSFSDFLVKIQELKLPTLNALGTQVWANIVDFCDSDNVPTSDYDGENIPTYMGNEKCFYLNELALVWKLDRDGANQKITFKCQPKIEIVNIYGNASAVGDKVKIRVYYEVQKADGSKLSEEELKYDSGKKYKELTGTIGSPEKNINLVEWPLEEFAVALNVVADQEGNLPTYQIVVSKVIMSVEASSEVVDLAYLDFSSMPMKSDLLETPNDIFFHFECIDPRCNLLLKDASSGVEYWKKMLVMASPSELGADPPPASPNHSLGIVNKAFKDFPKEGKDKENYDVIDFSKDSKKTFSTAFIKNAPFETFWELGAIHKGKLFETIKLYKDESSSGDIALFDEIKIGPLQKVRGKINPKFLVKQTVDQLFKNIDNSSYDKLFEERSPSEPSSYDFKNYNDVLKYSYNKNRSIFAENLDFTAANLVDRDVEGYICKVMPFLDTRWERIVVVTATEVVEEDIRKSNEVRVLNWDVSISHVLFDSLLNKWEIVKYFHVGE